MIYNEIKHVLKHFAFEGTYDSVEEMLSGNINNTFHLYYRDKGGRQIQYVLQQINSYAFKQPELVMSNAVRVTNHLRANAEQRGLPAERCTLSYVPCDNGEYLYVDSQKRYWRAYNFIDNAKAYNRVEKPEQFYEAGAAFGEFQRLLSDFPVDELYETIPYFHDTRRRFYSFVASVAEDKAGRVKQLEPEIDFLFDRRKRMYSIVQMIQAGELPLRVTHNDTKINNVMLDRDTGEALCVIDLDTVMAGSSLYDFGDAIRFGASTADEDETDLDRGRMDLGLFSAFTEGFVEQTAAALTLAELENLPLGARVMTYENGLRFLTDYLDGDVYFHIDHPGHNLDRARNQFRLLEDMEEKRGAMDATVRALIEKYR